MSFWKNITNGAVSGVLDSGTKLARVFVKDKSAIETNAHLKEVAQLSMFAAQVSKENKNWLDSVMDFISRIPRPAITFLTIYLLVIAFADPVRFAIGINNLQLIPIEIWSLVGAVVSFYFVSREFTKSREHKKNVDVLAKVKEILEINKELKKLKEDENENNGAG